MDHKTATLEDRQKDLETFDAYVAKNKAAGWPTEELRIAAERLRFALLGSRQQRSGASDAAGAIGEADR